MAHGQTSWAARVLSERRRAWLASPRLALVAALISVALCLPSLGAGLILDDHFHRLALLGLAGELRGVPPGGLDLFRFMPGDAAFNAAARVQGTLPWWIPDDLRLAFWRPLASATHWLDYRLWPESPALMHLHNLAWLAALVGLVARLYRELGPAESGPPRAWVVGLATLLFALYSGLGVPGSWIANRNALIAGVLGVACVLVHARAARLERAGASRAALAAKLGAPALLALALLAGEIALGVAAYLGAYALFLDPRGRRRGLVALAPAAAVVVAWRLAYSALGYGAAGSLHYVDPVATPLRFLAAVAERAPLLVFKLFGGPPSHLSGLAPRSEQIGASIVAALGLALIAYVVAPQLRRADPRGAQLRFWITGALACCVPACATTAHDRLLILAAIGSSMAVAQLLALLVDEDPGPGLRRLGAVWLVSLGLLNPALLALDGLSLRMIVSPQQLALRSLPEGLGGRTLMIVNVPEPLSMCAQLPFVLASRGQPYPARLRCMGASEGPVELRRPNPSALVLAAADGYLIGPNAALLDDGDRTRFAPGSRWELGELDVEVMATTADGRPQNVAFYFDSPLEREPERVWLVWTEAGFVELELPAVGERLALPAVPLIP